MSQQRMVVIRREPDAIEIREPIRFQVVRKSDLSILVNRHYVASIAAALCMATNDPAERKGIIEMAKALGVEVV